MGTYKTNWQLTETVMPEDMNRIEENIKENNTNLEEFKKKYTTDSKEENKKIDAKAEKDDVLLKVGIPEDRDCNSFKELNAFCTFDTGAGDFRNTPEGTLAKGSSRVFLLINRGFTTTRFQQEFINLYPQDRVTRYVRNFNADGNGNWGNWWKVYDEANKPTPADIGAVNKNGDKVTGTINFEANGNEIEIVNPSQGLQARGMVFKDNYTNNNIIGMFGAYMNSVEILKAFIGTTDTPWDGRKSFSVDKQGCYYDNQKIYHVGNKPSPEELKAFGGCGFYGVGTDLNNLVENGAYEINEISKCTNGIQGVYDWGTLVVFNSKRIPQNNGQRITQIYYPHIIRDGVRIPYMRVKDNVTWTEWEPITKGFNWNDLAGKPSSFPPSNHNHDNRYLPLVNGSTNESYKLQKKFIEVGVDDTKIIEIGVGPTDIYMHNTKSDKYFALKDNGELLYDGKKVLRDIQGSPLWQGFHHMSGKESVTPSKALSECNNGWVLVWSDWDDGVGTQDWNFCFTYIPKNTPWKNGKNHTFPLSAGEDTWAIKTLYVYDTYFRGNDTNKNGGNYDVILRAVLEY